MSLVGTTIGHIRFESLLGVGGMGEVYRAFDEKLQRVVAVKTIRTEHRLSGTARARFLREARILSRLANPLICQVYDLIEAEEADLLVLEFVEGETLDDLRAGTTARRAPGARARREDRRGPDGGAPRAHHPSRPQAGEHHGARRRER